MSARASNAAAVLALAFMTSAAAQEGIERRRPQAPLPREAPQPEAAQDGVAPPPAGALRESLPVDDRWRILKSLGLMPYRAWDPYNPNVLKGDLPLASGPLKGWFVNVTAVSDTVLEWRRLPTPVGAQATRAPGSPGPFVNGRQSLFSETLILGVSLIKGETVYRPPELELRFVPVLNATRAEAQERRVLNADPQAGTTRNDQFAGVQELFVDKHLRDVSPRYDFDSVRVGIQPFTADFRGFLFLDQPFGVRFFGTRDNNRWQYNAGWFRRLEKDTNSGLNDLGQRLRADDSYVFNLYRQDWPVPGFTSQAIVIHNRNREGDLGSYVDANGFVQRPAPLGTMRARNYELTYAGLNGDGHFGRWNASASGYYAFGTDERGVLSGRRETIGAWFGALELSRDFDWVRLRATGVYASGDRDPFDGKASGFDAIVENPAIAGAETSYWIRQAVPFVGGGGVALSMRNGMLPSLRTSREHGQSNFTNPGLRLLGLGADLDLAPQVRLIGNANHLAFDDLSSLAALRNQRLIDRDIGWDLSLALQYRPLFIQNVVLSASFALLIAGNGLRALYGDAVRSDQYSALVSMVLTF